MHVAGFPEKERLFFGRALMAARSRFVVNQIRIRGPDDFVTTLRRAQAKVDVVESDAEVLLIEPIELVENGFAQNHARPGYGRTILLEEGAVEISGMAARNVRKRMTGHTAQAENHATVLESSVRIPKPRADRADSQSRRVTDHFREPAWIVDLGVVIQEHEDLALRLRRGAVVETAVVEGTGFIQDPRNFFPLDPAEKSKGLFFPRSVIGDDDFKGTIIGARADALHTTLQ